MEVTGDEHEGAFLVHVMLHLLIFEYQLTDGAGHRRERTHGQVVLCDILKRSGIRAMLARVGTLRAAV